MKTVYVVYSYDVWGNAEDGYNVNDTFRVGIEVELRPEAPDSEVVEALKKVGYLKQIVEATQIEVDGDEEVITLNDASDGQPICELRKKEVA